MSNESSMQQTNTVMPRKQKEVWLAINQLIQEGLHPDMITNPLIGDRLEELGYKRGSGSDLSRYKNAWLTACRSQQSTFVETLSPGLLSDPIAQAVQSLKAKLIAESQEEIANIKKIATEKVQQALDQASQSQQEVQRALDDAEKAQQALESIRMQNILLEKKLSELLIKLEFTQEQNEQLQIEHNKTIIKYAELEKLQTQQLQTVEKIYDSLKEDNRQTLDQVMTKQENERHTWINEKDQLKTEIKKINQRLLEKNDALQSQKTELEKSKAQISSLQEKVNTYSSITALFELTQQVQASHYIKQQETLSLLKKLMLNHFQDIKFNTASVQSSNILLLEKIKLIENGLDQFDSISYKQLIEKLNALLKALDESSVAS